VPFLVTYPLTEVLLNLVPVADDPVFPGPLAQRRGEQRKTSAMEMARNFILPSGNAFIGPHIGADDKSISVVYALPKHLICIVNLLPHAPDCCRRTFRTDIDTPWRGDAR